MLIRELLRTTSFDELLNGKEHCLDLLASRDRVPLALTIYEEEIIRRLSELKKRTTAEFNHLVNAARTSHVMYR